MQKDHDRFMRMALEEAERAAREGNVGVGSVIVRGNSVIAHGRNLVTTTHDVTAHAETVALRNAGVTARLVDFTGCTLYTTYEPCAMCCGAIVWGKVSRLVMGGRPDPKEHRWGGYTVEKLVALMKPFATVEIVTGVLTKECEQAYRLTRPAAR